MKKYVVLGLLLHQIFNVFIGVSSQIISESRWTILEDENGYFEIVDLEATPEDSYSTLEELKEEVAFYLYTPTNPKHAQRIDFEENINETRLEDTYFNVSNPTRICIHGWKNSVASNCCMRIREAYLATGDYNVITVDWSKYAKRNYIYARSKIVTVGEYVGLMIDVLGLNGVNTTDLTIIGHSLGAHVSGIAGRSSVEDVGIIIALDPAGPLFYLVNQYARIRKTDALFVQVVHTAAGILGQFQDLGDVDIWVNGGLIQPGCGLDIYQSCAHSRAYYYYAESVRYDDIKFSTRRCVTYAFYELGFCDSNESTYLGGIEVDTQASGLHYVDTDDTSIYALDE